MPTRAVGNVTKMVAWLLAKMRRPLRVLLGVFRPRSQGTNNNVGQAGGRWANDQSVLAEVARANGSATVCNAGTAPENTVKLVVWDLDDTFWCGTLAEGGVTAIEHNIELIKHLNSRGIVNSICSKNDERQARRKLVELGIFNHFVFPRISYDPKGQTIAELIQSVALRAENVLFIDDNHLNREEVRYYNPGIMAAHPADVLDRLRDHPECGRQTGSGNVAAETV
jgi:HAD superfamily phosphatase (TIGR01681 family)